MMIMNALSSRTLEKGRTEGDEECVQELYEAAQGHAHQPRRSGKSTSCLGGWDIIVEISELRCLVDC